MVMASLRAIVAALAIIRSRRGSCPAASTSPARTGRLVVCCSSAAGRRVRRLLARDRRRAAEINVMFAVVLTPLLFTGATFIPWQR